MTEVLLIVIGIVAIVAIPILLIAATGGLIQTEHPLPRARRRRARKKTETR